MRAGIGGQEYSFTVGEMLVIFPGMQHSYIRSENCRGVALTFSQEMLASLERDFSALQPEFPILRIDDLDRDVPYCLDRLKEMQAQSMMNEELAEAYLSLMFLRLLPQLQPREPVLAVTGDLLYQAMQYISQNMSQPLNIRSTARALGVNTYYLSRVLNERLHMGFRGYLNTLRIERARRLLRATSRPIEEIGVACGFINLRTFDRVFAERCGCTPRDFRRAAAKGTSETDK